ncbi:2-succinylbenzoate--CoA ligase [Panicum miliaceum]|uniref:2-succinylbenzoate--CoA ligase n=1 Tax=Panicum miliaceum TaxID=4540 RepID=A0A3L6RTY4_PANMI|nr:2-succinylbenzoate--CoA ligase [Panicum miliaceum]
MDSLGANAANSCPLTPLGFLERAATVYGDCPSVVYHDTVFTWSQTFRRCLRLASALVSLGIPRRDVVSVLLPNVPAMYEAHFGVPMSGAVLNTINTRLDARTVSVLLRHSGSRLVLGVVHCHRAIFLVTLDSLVDWAVPPRPTYLWTLPMFHTNGWSFPWGMAVVGGTNVCLRRVDAAEVYATIARRGVTHMCGAPVVLNMLANAPGKVHILTAGEPPPAAVLHRTEAAGFEVSHGYGLTETAGVVVCCSWKGEWNKLPASERARLKARQGVRTPGTTEMDVVDSDTGRSVPRDGATMGEVVLRGGCVMLGYLNDDEATRAAIRGDGWFYTGDVGVMHPDGYLEIRDRSKDVIISGGENISSVELESVLYWHPAVSEAAAVARPDEFWGETPCAFVSLREGAAGKVTEAEIVAWCRERMPHYMAPKTVVFLPELPKTSTGKVQKYVLRDAAKKMGPTGRGNTTSKM